MKRLLVLLFLLACCIQVPIMGMGQFFTKKIEFELGEQTATRLGDAIGNGVAKGGKAMAQSTGEVFDAFGAGTTRLTQTTAGNMNTMTSSLGTMYNKLTQVFVDNAEKVRKEVLLKNRNDFIKGAVLMAAGVTAVYTTGFIIQHIMAKYIAKRFFEPALIEKRSGGIVSRMATWFKKPVNLKDHMVISAQLEKDLNYIIKMTSNIKKNGGHFENVLLHGVPGTGKTLFAQLLAQSCGMDYAIIPAANVSQFLANGTAVEELNRLFEWAARSSRGTIIFFDEAETFLAQRATLSAAAQNALGAFLAKTGTPSNKIMIICATNRPEILDDAVRSRLGKSVKFPLPALQDRQKQLVMHIKDVFGKQQGKQISYSYLTAATIESIAQQLEGCSGRTIQKFVNRLRQAALAEDLSSINKALIDEVIRQVKNDQGLIKSHGKTTSKLPVAASTSKRLAATGNVVGARMAVRAKRHTLTRPARV